MASALKAAEEALVRGQPDDAVESAQQALSESRKANYKKGAAEALHVVIAAKIADGKIAEALKQATEEKEQFEKSGDTYGLGKMLLSSGEVSLAQDKLQDALKYGNSAVDAFREIGDKGQEAFALNFTSTCLLESDPAAAVKGAEAALEIAKAAADKKWQASAYYSLIGAQSANGKYEEALAAANEALQIYTELEDKSSEAITYQTIARVQMAQDNYESAIIAAASALGMFQEMGNLVSEVGALELVATAYLQNGQLVEAMRLAKEELAVFRAMGDTCAESLALRVLSMIYLAKEDVEQAKKYGNEAIEKAKASGKKRAYVHCLLTLCELGMSQNELDEAMQAALEASRVADEAGYMKGKATADSLCKQIAEGDNPQKSPDRAEALKILATMAEALQERDEQKFQDATERLCYVSGYSQADMSKYLEPAMGADRQDALDFLRKNMVTSSTALATTQDGVAGDEKKGEIKMRCIDKTAVYMQFRYNGLGYGPHFRAQQTTFRITDEDPDQNVGIAMLRTASVTEDWEANCRFIPGILDSALQTGQALGM